MLDCSYIISVYKNIKNLEIIFFALSKQTFKNFEVIIAEDGESTEMKNVITVLKSKYSFAVKHVSQEDNGFQKCKVLNKAIAICNSEYLIFTDGDCVPHRFFIHQHVRCRKYNLALFGRRVMLSNTFTNKLYHNHTLLFSPFLIFYLLLYKCSRLDAAIYLPFFYNKKKEGIWGCNWSIYKKDILLIDGFDEDYNLPGFGEDTDIEWRLRKKGIEFKHIKNRAIQYHLWHAINYQDTSKMEELMSYKKSIYIN